MQHPKWVLSACQCAMGVAPAVAFLLVMATGGALRAQEVKYTNLYNFPGSVSSEPNWGVIRDSAGNLYGTTIFGGNYGVGTVFKLDTSGTQTILCNFADGAYPSNIVLDAAGNIYGATANGGPYEVPFQNLGYGLVYKLDTSGTETVLYNFTGGTDGEYPGGVIRDAAGNIYGTAAGGALGNGLVYKLDASGAETVLYSFTGGADGGSPWVPLIRDSSGNLYGTTASGGLGSGVVFKLDTSGTETVLYSFTGGADGGSPNIIIRDSAGNIYGTAAAGGASGYGVVFKLDTTGTETVLHSFSGGTDSMYPDGLIRDPLGNLYGTAGGLNLSSGFIKGYGVVFKLSPKGKFTVLHEFNHAEGAFPAPGLIRDSAGTLYGTTELGGTSDWGVVFSLKP